MKALTLSFEGVNLHPVKRDGEAWIRMSQLGMALYGNGLDEAELPVGTGVRQLQNLFLRHSDEFTSSMTRVIKLSTAGGKQAIRVFSLRGAHLLAMFARTDTAKKFRIWVLDILDSEVTRQPVAPKPSALSWAARIDLEGLCAEAQFMSAWFKKFGPAIELLNPRLFSATFEMPMIAGMRAKSLAKEFGLNFMDGYYDKYPWHETPGHKLAYREDFERSKKVATAG